ncbi:hypothetical protein [Clostridium oryzae]|uniref:Dephospho-CoA kinase n=1 Tax=Clostridium oryzae TaxID=1450648 RepID=A0A1V4IIK3_9CLOT|nr:hypothetical protein [Clostridium oryzae]OPJ59327.1 hypothetical protein CLORY_33360 [Clostridium oryzae]
MNKIYNGIVIFGEMGSGKDTLARMIEDIRDDSKIYNMGVLCREMMKVAKVNPKWKGQERFIGQTIADKFRELDINIMCDYILSLILGDSLVSIDNNEDYVNSITNELRNVRKNQLSIIVGGRTLTDFEYWRKLDFFMLGIKVGEKVRETRLKERDGAETAQNSSSKHNTEKDVSYIINNLCDAVIVNDGTLDDLRTNINSVLIQNRI